MHQQRTAILIAAAVGMVGTFLPWYNAFIISINGTNDPDRIGWITLLLFGGILLTTLAGDRESALKGGSLGIAFLLALGAGFLALWRISGFRSAIGRSSTEGPFARSLSSMISVGFGLYIVLLAAVGIILLGLFLQKK